MKNYLQVRSVPATLFSALFLISVISCKKEAPGVVTLSVTDITHESANTGGNVTDEGDGTVVMRGIVWGESDPTLESNDGLLSQHAGLGIFSFQMTRLKPYTDYVVKSFASSEFGTTYGNPLNFQTLVKLATIQTTAPYDITITGATTGGTISDSGGSEITARGIYVGTTNSPEISGTKISAGSGSGSFTVTLSDLLEETVYYVKAFAVNQRGESLGGLAFFTTGHNLSFGPIIYNPNLTYGSVSDIDGNTYKTIVIGTQTWMAEDLKTTRYNDNSAIPNVTDYSEWGTQASGAYTWYNNISAYSSCLGALYNWFVTQTGKICPAGWHVPSDAEWTTLTTYLGGESLAGGKMKEIGLTHWNSPNEGATNSSGFTALPAGQRKADGSFDGLGSYDTWWTSTPYNEIKPYYRSNAAINTDCFRGYGTLNTTGKAIRCVKN